MNYQFIKDSRAMLVGNYLVVADLHIGYAKTLEERGYNIPNQMKAFLKSIKELKQQSGAENLVILGDVKHNIPRIALQEKYDIPDFFYELAEVFRKVVVIKGNHDGQIELMIHPKNVELKKEFLLDGFGFIHGHSYPSTEFMKKCRVLIMGHIHPVFKVKDALGELHIYPCWIISSLKKSKLKKYKETSVEKVIVVPVFNPLFTGYERLAGPFANALKREEIFLLDLTKVK
jgi:hypothetical protein